MTIALVLFALAALGGVTMAAIRFRGAERPPTALALLHGVLAAAGIIVLIVAMLHTTNPAQARTALADAGESPIASGSGLLLPKQLWPLESQRGE